MIRNFDDNMDLTIENYLYVKDNKELDIYLEVSYRARGYVEESTRYCPWSEDTPDGADLDILDVSVDFYEVYNEDGEPCHIVLTPDDIRKIENDLYSKAEKHYYDYGNWAA